MRKRLGLFVGLAAVIVASAAIGQVPFNGTWSINELGASPVFSGSAQFDNGTAAVPSIAWTADADGSGTGLFRPAANQVGVSANGVNQLTVASGSVTAGAGVNVLAGANASIGMSARALLNSPSDGILQLTNNAGTAFTSLQFGGSAATFPEIKRNATALNVRLADDSADAGLTCSSLTASTSVVVGSGSDTSTITEIANDATVGDVLSVNTYVHSFGNGFFVSSANTGASSYNHLGQGSLGFRSNSVGVTFSNSNNSSFNASDTNLSKVSAGVLGVGTGAQGSIAGSISAAKHIAGDGTNALPSVIGTDTDSGISFGSNLVEINVSAASGLGIDTVGLYQPSAGVYRFASRSTIRSGADRTMSLRNNAGTAPAETLIARPFGTATGTYTLDILVDCGGVIQDLTDGAVVTLPAIVAGSKGCQVTLQNTATAAAAGIQFTSNAADNICGTVGAITSNCTSANVWINTKATAKKGDYTTAISDGVHGWWIVGGVGLWSN